MRVSFANASAHVGISSFLKLIRILTNEFVRRTRSMPLNVAGGDGDEEQ